MSCISCNSFGTNCPYHKTKFGGNCKNMYKFGIVYGCGNPVQGSQYNSFGVKAPAVKGYGSLTKDTLKIFLQMHGHDLDLSATKDNLFKQVRKIYPSISPAEIKQSINTRTSYESMKLVKDTVKAQEKEAKERARLEKIKKVLYTPREKKFEEVISRRLPAGSTVKRLTRPAIKPSDVDDLIDMFSAARASHDEMSDLFTKLNVKFGKNKFGA